MGEILRCESLTKAYGSSVALNNVNLSLESGRIIGLLGPNGSGKTTLIKLINGLLMPTSGGILIGGTAPSMDTKRVVAYLPDNDFLPSWMTVEQIVKFFCDFYEDFRPKLAYEMLDKLQISRKSRLKTLSKGNREKVCLILVMSRNARLYVLDEPIAAVDPATRDYVISTIINNYNPESSVIISTHLISDVEPILDEAIFIHLGNIILHQAADELREEKGMSIDAYFREVFRW